MTHPQPNTASMTGSVPHPRTGLRSRQHPHLYQIHTWVWLDQLSRQAGRSVRLGDVPDTEWDHLARQGFDLVYLLGMWQRSPAGRHIFRTDAASFPVFDQALPGWTVRSIVGSPFSIRDYTPDERIGSWDDLDAARAKLHARGMRLILDFIPNHTGPDHVWVGRHPEYYLRGSEADYHRDPSAFHLVEREHGEPLFIARGRDPYFAPWADTAQLDYFNPATRAALVDTLRALSEHCDGLRCDMAMLVLNDVFHKTWGALLRDTPPPAREFWEEAIAALPGDFLWMAEVYWDMEWRLQQLGFSATYDKRLYDRLREAPPSEVMAHLNADLGYQTRMARFLENHDEPRSAATFGRERLSGLVPLLCTLPGLRFFHQGQFEGRKVRVPMPLDAAVEEAPDRELEALYARALAIADEEVFHDGEWRRLEVRSAEDGHTADTLLAYRWRSSCAYKLIVVNLGGGTAQGLVALGDELGTAPSYAFRDELNGPSYTHMAEHLRDGLYVRLEAHRAHMFDVSAVATS